MKPFSCIFDIFSSASSSLGLPWWPPTFLSGLWTKALVAVYCLTFNGRLVLLWTHQLPPVSVTVVSRLMLGTLSPLRTLIRPAATKEAADDVTSWSLLASICGNLLLFLLALLLLITIEWLPLHKSCCAAAVGLLRERAPADLLKSHKCETTVITFIIRCHRVHVGQCAAAIMQMRIFKPPFITATAGRRIYLPFGWILIGRV